MHVCFVLLWPVLQTHGFGSDCRQAGTLFSMTYVHMHVLPTTFGRLVLSMFVYFVLL
jgi:hypothetical protein